MSAVWKVQATKQGFADQYLHEIGEVFELVMNEDGTMPLKMVNVPVLDATGKPTNEFTEEVFLDENGEPVHAHYSPHDDEWKGIGIFKGETFREGWMRRVPDETPCGLYPADVEFGVAAKAPIQRIIRPAGTALHAPMAAQPRGKIDRTFRTGV